MNLPENWTTERALGRLDIHHLIHVPCGFRSFVPFNLDEDEGNARRLIVSHECKPAPPSIGDLSDAQFYGSRDGRGNEETGVHRDGDELTLVIDGHRVRFDDIDDALFLADQLKDAYEDAMRRLP